MKIENKISKICWNTKNWKFPSGSEGKSPSSTSYESQYGYGHEEWLFDKSRIIEGFHYAFLQPLNLKTDRHVGKTYNISLFTVFNSTRYFVGKIKSAVCISKEESKQIYKIYKRSGWIKEMATELESAGADPTPLKETPPEIFFNIKFQFKNVEFTTSGDLEEISENDPNITTNRYKLLPHVNGVFLNADTSEHQGNLKNTKKRKRKSGGNITFDPIHDKIQNVLCSILRSSYTDLYKKVDIETGRVDIKALTHDNQWHFFEIKTDNAKLSIRKGIGQLLEYSFFPEKNIAQKLVVVSDSPLNKDTKKYLKHIRTTFSLPIYYRQFDLEKNELSVEY
jgi:hypothetical protein